MEEKNENEEKDNKEKKIFMTEPSIKIKEGGVVNLTAKKEEVLMNTDKKAEEINKEEKDNFPNGGKMYLEINENFKHRSWSDPYSRWVIYRGRKKLTPSRWSRVMKNAVRKGILRVVERSPTGKIDSFNPKGAKGVEVREIKEVKSGEDSRLEKDKIITLSNNSKEIIMEKKEDEKIDAVIKERKATEIEVNIKDKKPLQNFKETR